ncbi:MAG TPA: hypothetical protein VKU41_07400, partial [Polyangiaceae bacterium]|nr:hypothetical protein [Polyangiaceae bacterium]
MFFSLAFVTLGLATAAQACGGAAFDAALPGADDGGIGPDAAGKEGAPPDGTADTLAEADADAADALDAPSPDAPDADETGGTGMCPVAASIQDGLACTSPPLRCPSAMPIYVCGTGNVTGYTTCTCILKRWSCPSPTCVDAGSPPVDVTTPCPAPKLVAAGQPCTGSSVCPGNPQTCNGMTDFDAFQC